MKLTVFSLICLVLIFAFAGVQPLAGHKDNLIKKWEEYQVKQEAQQTEQEAREAAEYQRRKTEREQIESARIETAGQEQLKVEQSRKETEDEAKKIKELEQQKLPSVDGFTSLFNEYRNSYGLQALTFTDDLNTIATLRLSELKLDYSHNSLGNYNLHLAENINMISFGSLSDRDAFNSWKSSPGHNTNMLDPNYKNTGYANGGGYAIQLFSEYPTVNGEPQLPPGWYWDD